MEWAFTITLVCFLISLTLCTIELYRSSDKVREYKQRLGEAEERISEAQSLEKLVRFKAEDLEREREQLTVELSDSLRREQNLQERFDKHAETLRIATTSLDEERRLREQTEEMADKLHKTISAAVELLEKT